MDAFGKVYDYPEWDSDRDELPDGSILLLSDARGRYIPQNFAESVDYADTSGIKQGDWMILESGPDHEWYWQAWDAVCSDGAVRSPATGTVYAIYQDGDCWLIPLTERAALAKVGAP